MNDRRRTGIVIGASVYGGLLVGLASLLVAYAAFSNLDWTGAGVALLAGAVAFGLVANAVLRS
ncbi:MAG TPA: hypothetical protein VLL48_08485 [Longimicrobiales bacterium]|nr:hypothetical protein [Longimicrobiales bacterium]